MTFFDTSDDLPYIHLLVPTEIAIELTMTVLVPWCAFFRHLVDEASD